MAKKKKVKVADLVDGPIRHAELPPQLLIRIKAIYDTVGHYTCSTLERWEIDFMRDMHPEREIAVWEIIAAAWKRFEREYSGKKLTNDEKGNCVRILTSISMGLMDLKQIVNMKGPKIDLETIELLGRCYIEGGKDILRK